MLRSHAASPGNSDRAPAPRDAPLAPARDGRDARDARRPGPAGPARVGGRAGPGGGGQLLRGARPFQSTGHCRLGPFVRKPRCEGFRGDACHVQCEPSPGRPAPSQPLSAPPRGAESRRPSLYPNSSPARGSPPGPTDQSRPAQAPGPLCGPDPEKAIPFIAQWTEEAAGEPPRKRPKSSAKATARPVGEQAPSPAEMRERYRQMREGHF